VAKLNNNLRLNFLRRFVMGL